MKAFLIPGSGEDLQSRDYQAVLNTYKRHGYEPQFVSIRWRYRTFDSWLENVRVQVPEKDLANGLLSGFSWGAMLAVATASRIANPKILHIYSLSPYFSEDMPLPEKYEKAAGKRRVENFKKLSFNDLADKMKCPTTIFLGSKEKEKYADMWRRTSEGKKRIRNSSFILVEGASHDVSDARYVEAIDGAIS